MRLAQEALRLLARVLVDGVDEQDMALPLVGLPRPADDDARLHRAVVEEAGPEPEDALKKVSLEELAAHLALLVSE